MIIMNFCLKTVHLNMMFTVTTFKKCSIPFFQLTYIFSISALQFVDIVNYFLR